MKFTHYLALGDSISIDKYPSLDTNGEARLKVGAASLLAAKLRAVHNPRLEFMNRTFDGASIPDISELQLPRAALYHGLGENLLITLTAGGNDISFSAMSTRNTDMWQSSILPLIASEWYALVRRLLKEFDGATIIVNTLYDPTEGTGTFGGDLVAGAWEEIAKEYSTGRWFLSEAIKRYMAKMPSNVILTDIREIFGGHGVTAPKAERWYWREFMIEPNAEGARQISQRWMSDLHAHVTKARPITNVVRDLKEYETVTP